MCMAAGGGAIIKGERTGVETEIDKVQFAGLAPLNVISAGCSRKMR